MELLKGQTLGDYAVLKEIGHGGVGRVYEVEHTITRRREAVKVVSFESHADTEKSERFLREIRLQAALNHPNIASVHNAFWTDDNFILVSELLDGEPLQAVIARGKLSVDRSLEIIRQVLAALRCAHSRGIMHRDISPANIFVTSAGPVKLIDFGLAKASTDLNLTQAGLAVGSFYYTSPEQIRAEPTVDIRTDLYSCGAILYEMLTGRKPFDGTAFEVMQAHCERTPVTPSSIEPSVPGVISDVVMKALAKRPDSRYGSADDFLRGLEEIAVAKPAAKVKVAPLVLVASVVLAAVIGFVVLRSEPEAGAALAGPAPVVQVETTPIAAPVDAPLTIAPPVDEKKVAVRTAPKEVLAVSPPPTLTDEFTEQANPVTEAMPVAAPETKAEEPPFSRGVIGAMKKLNPFRKKKNGSQ